MCELNNFVNIIILYLYKCKHPHVLYVKIIFAELFGILAVD